MKYVLVVAAVVAGWIAWRSTAPKPPSPRKAVPLAGPHEGRVSAIAGGAIPISGDVHGRLVVWSTPPDSWIAHDGAVRRILRVDDGLISVGGDGSVARWRLDGRVVWRRRHPEALNDAAWTQGALIVATVRGTIARLGAQQPIWQSRGAHGQAAFAIVGAGDAVLTTGTDGRIAERAIADGALRRVQDASAHWIGAMARTSDGIVFADGAGQLGRQRGDTFTVQAAMDGPGVALAAHPKFIAMGGERGGIALFDANGGKLREIPTDHPVMSLAWRGDELLSGGGADGAVRIWRVKDGAEVGRLPEPKTAATQPGSTP